jgi:hypothetical protein
VAYDEDLANRIRELTARESGVAYARSLPPKGY